MARFNKLLLIRTALCAAVVCISAAVFFGQVMNVQVAQPGGVAKSDKEAKGPKLMPLVNADPDLASYLAKIEQVIADKDYDTSIKMIQEIIEKGEGFFEASADARVYVSIRKKANDLLGKLGPEGLVKYRNLYDAPAERLYQDGIAQCDIAMLQRVIDRYLYATSGAKALDALGSLYFDAGKFIQAAYYWRQLVQMDPKSAQAPACRAKMILAMHLSGDASGADAGLAELQKECPQAKAVLCGQEQGIAEFVQKVRKEAVVSFVPAVAMSSGSYPGLGSLTGGFGRMSDVDMILTPRWARPGVDLTAADLVKNLLIVKTGLAQQNPQMMGQPGPKTAVEFRNGHIQIRGNAVNYNYGGGASFRQYMLPAMIHPVITDGKVIIRTGTRIEAYDLVDGELKWASDQPLLRTLNSKVNAGYNPYGNMLQKVGDNGRYAMTVGGGKVFALSHFRPMVYIQPMFGGGGGPQQPKDDSLVDNSRLIAVWANSGKLVDGWEVGGGKGTDDVVRNGKFVSAPGFSNNRIYAVMTYLENGFYLVCLDAEDGRLIWKQFIAQSPTFNPQFGQMTDMYVYGSPPMVSDGKVFVVTNLGVIAASDANTGQPLWAYQYESQVEASLRANPYGGQPITLQASNPIIAVRGRIICLPSDSSKILALSAEDGSPIWTAEREGRSDLTGIDENRVVLTGPDMKVYSTQDGQELFTSPNIREANGRPAVTASSILLSGPGLVYRVSLNDYSISQVELADADGLLGNLVSVDGKLIAANALGICAYFKFEDARNEINRRIEASTGAAKFEAIMRRAQLAFSAGRYEEAVEDYKTCLSPASTQQAQDVAKLASPGLYRTYVAMGNAAANPEQTVQHFTSAAAIADTGTAKAEMKLRLAKALQKAGKCDQAAAAAQELSEQMGDEEIVDVVVGPESKDKARFSIKEPTRPARELAQGFLRRLIETQGRDCYKQFDADAAKDYQQALQAGEADKLEGIFQRWPNSAVAYDALYAAAELNYKASQSKTGTDSEVLLDKALRQLHGVYNEPSTPRQMQATVAMAAIYSREQWGQTMASLLLDPVREQPAATEIAFADIKGKLGDLLTQIDGGKLPRAGASVRMKSSVETPLREVFAMADADAFILRDQDYNPVRLGESIAIVKGTRIVMFDTAARDDEQAVEKWSALSTASGMDIRKRQAYLQQVVCGLSADGTVLAIADKDAVTGINIATAKIRYQKKLSDMSVGGPVYLAVGGGYMICLDASGNLAGVDLASGEHWQNTINVVKPNPQMGQPGTVIGIPQIGGGVVIIPLNQMRSLVAYSLKSGKILQKWDGTKVADALITPDGLIATLVDNTLDVREGKNLDKPLWTKKYEDPATTLSLLAVSKDNIALAVRNRSQIEVLPVTGGGKVSATLRAKDVGGATAVPLEGKFDEGALYVSCSIATVVSRRANPNQPINLRNLSIQKFDLTAASEQPVWARALDMDPQNGGGLLPLVVGKQVAVTVKSFRPEAPGNVVLLDSKDGQVLSKSASLAGRNAEGKADRLRHLAIGTPVLLDGRLCVETIEGITVYGK